MLAITGGKGGCGKTTTALGVSRELARRGADPLVVDTDTDMPDLHHLAGVSREPSMDQLSEETPLSAVVQKSERFPGVSVLTAGRRNQVDKALRKARQWRGPVIVDCPPGLGPGTVGPLRVARGALVVTTEQPTCLEDTRQTIRTLRRVGTAPSGVLLLSRSSRRPPQAVAGCRTLETAPFSKTPFEDDRASRAWQRVAGEIRTDRTQCQTDEHRPTSNPDTPVSGPIP